MNEPKLTQQEQRALLELECELARLKIKNAHRHTRMVAASSQSSWNAMQLAQTLSDVQHNPMWKVVMSYGRGKQKLLLGAALLAWQILSNKQK